MIGKPEIILGPTTVGLTGKRVWYAAVTLPGHKSVDYDGAGDTIEMALCDLVDSLAMALAGKEED